MDAAGLPLKLSGPFLMTFAQRMHSTLSNPSIPKSDSEQRFRVVARRAKRSGYELPLVFWLGWTRMAAIGLSLFCFFAWWIVS